MRNGAALFSLTDALLLAMVTLWAINYTVVKNVISADLAPIAFTALRFGLASLALLPLLSSTRSLNQPITGRDRWKIAGLGLLGNTLYQLFFINGINYTSPTNSALILASAPVFVALIGALLKIERLNGLAWLGVLLSFGGIGLVILGGAPAESTAAASNSLLGDLLTLAAAVVWATYTVLAAPLLRRHSAIRLTSFAIIVGTLPLLLIATPTFLTTDWSKVGLNSWLGVIYSGLLAIAIGYMIWNNGVQKVGGARTAVYSNLTPVLTAVVAFLVRGDPLTIFHALGAAVILSGIALTRVGRGHVVPPIEIEPIEG
jgi:drug/metabolite transporter (DMT)-like permease